jgi:acyl carrier protein
MSDDELRAAVIRVLCDVAPEVRPEAIDPTANLRDSLDLDSVDFMNFVVGLHDTLGVDVPESDYAKLASIDDCVAYLRARRAAQ